MRLKPGRPETPYAFARGLGAASIPDTGDINKPLSAAWWTREQVLGSASLEYRPGKIFLGRVDQKMIGIEDDRHLMMVAGSRGGKSVCLLIPNLLLYEGSALVIDPKGELAAATAEHRTKNLGQAVTVLDPWGVSGEGTAPYRGSFDPLTELRDDPGNLIENAELVADALIIPAERGESHWTDAARALVRALVIWLVLDPDGSGGSVDRLPSIIASMAAQGDEAGGLLDTLADLDPATAPEGQAEAFAVIASQAAMMLGTGDKERASILSTARTQLVFLDSPSMAASVAASALVLADLKRRPSTVYLCLPAARMGTHSRWLRLVVNLAVAALERERSRPKLPVLFVLEEFAALGHMRALEQAVAYMAGFGVKLWVVLQDLTQLKRHYKEGWETFLGNAGFIQAFSVSDLTTTKYLSDRLGQTTFQITNKQEVSASQSLQGDTGLRREFKTAPLISPDELSIKLRRVRHPDGTPSGLTLILPAGDARAFVVDRVFFGELE